MKKIAFLAVAIVIACAVTALLIGCPKPVEIPMSLYRGTVYGATPFFEDKELSVSEPYYFKSDDMIKINYTLTAEQGEEYKTYYINVGKLATEGGLFAIVDYVRDPDSIVDKYILSKNVRFAIIGVDS